MGNLCADQNIDRQFEHIYPEPDVRKDPSKVLHVLTAFFLPIYSQVRVQLYKRFAQHMMSFPEVELWTIECALNNSNYFVTTPQNPRNVQVRSSSRLWLKQNLLNVLMKSIPKEAQYIAWIDADVQFTNRGWAREAINKLKTCDLLQLFQDSDFLGPNGQVQFRAKSLMHYATKNLAMMKAFNQKPETYPHPGYAWAMSASYRNHILNLYEYSIIGSGDKFMAYSALGMWDFGLQSGVRYSEGYVYTCRQWAKRSIPSRGYSYVPGKLIHHYHGDRADRNYVARSKLLQKHNFDPIRDLTYNPQGVLELKPHQKMLQQEIDQYFVSRKQSLIRPPPPPINARPYNNGVVQRPQTNFNLNRRQPATRVVVRGGPTFAVSNRPVEVIQQYYHIPGQTIMGMEQYHHPGVVIQEIFEDRRDFDRMVVEEIRQDIDHHEVIDYAVDNDQGGGYEVIDYGANDNAWY